MRIYKKHPFSSPNSVRVDSLTLECDRLYRAYRDLLYLKKVVRDGKMTRELYDFLNVDGSMDDLLIGLPKPITGVACEALNVEQIAMIDAAVEIQAADIKKFILSIWEAFKEWFLDWWNVNRDVRFNLQSMASRFEANPASFGYLDDFRRMSLVTYGRQDWEAMASSCEEVNKLLETLPEKAEDLRAWIDKNVDSMNGSIAEFGQSCVKTTLKDGFEKYTLRIDNPIHSTVEMTMDAGRWVYSSMALYASRVHDILLDDGKCRRRFGRLESLFKTADATTASDLVFMRKFCERHAANVFVVANSILKIFKAMASNASAAGK